MIYYHTIVSYPTAEYSYGSNLDILPVRRNILIGRKRISTGKLNTYNIYNTHFQNVSSDITGIKTMYYNSYDTLTIDKFLDLDKFNNYLRLINSIDDPTIGHRFVKKHLLTKMNRYIEFFKTHFSNFDFDDPIVIVHSGNNDYKYRINDY